MKLQLLGGTLLVALTLPLIVIVSASLPRPNPTLPEVGCHCNRTDISLVCSNDSFTYGNECQLKCESQKRVKKRQYPIRADYKGECSFEGCLCTANVDPVCGTDDKTYDNECWLTCNSDKMVRLGLDPIYVKILGECPSECNCPIDIIPSCGSDGVTYSSSCLIDCENVERARLGIPPITRKPGACPDTGCTCPEEVDQPVCGTDGQTYRNKCELECESKRQESFGSPPITVKSNGKCPEEACICPPYLDVACGSDGRTYANECKLNCASKSSHKNGGAAIFFNHKGSCRLPSCNCPTTVSPVCGSNSKSYRNICWLDCASQINVSNGLPRIYLRANEVCRFESCVCPAIWKPVCGSDGKSYGTACAFRCHNARRFAMGLDPIAHLHEGECQPCICNKIGDPVCGSDGRTYGNPCEIGCENRWRKMRGLLPLNWTKGECGCLCPMVYQPVCASDLNTYGNKCFVGCENKQRAEDELPPLTISWEGECGCHCTDMVMPVCGTNRKTYRNVCWLNCACFAYIRNGWGAIYLKNNGPC